MRLQRRWLIFVTVSLTFFFITSATFMSLGVVLFDMARDLRWTQTEAGASFSILGLSCCLASLLPMALVNRFGTRWTMMLGGFVLAAGFLLAFLTPSLGVFFLATALMGVGFALCANIPGVYLLALWFPEWSGRIIGFYLMCGAFGGVAGPSLTQMIVAAEGWRHYWLLLAGISAALGLLCLLAIRDKWGGARLEASRGPDDWRYRDAVMTPQFFILALAMVITETCVTILHSAGVTHFAKFGLSAPFAAMILGLQALMATLGKGASGTLGDWVDPRLLLTGGLALESLGMFLLAFAGAPVPAYIFAVIFGLGWGTAYLTVTVLLIKYFGPSTGSSVLSLVWLMTACAALGPAGAGFVADRFNTFAPAFLICGGLLLPVVLAAALMRRPVPAEIAAAEVAEIAAAGIAE